MSARAATVATVVLALVGLVVSVALAIDHLGPAPAYCAADGCATVRESVWSRPFGIPTPLIGAGFFAMTLVLVAAAPRATDLRRGWQLAGGAIAIGFLVLQGAVIGAWCQLCIVADAAALALAVLAAAPIVLAPVRGRGAAGIAAVALAAVAVPIAIAEPAAPPPAPAVAAVPDAVAREQVAGAVTIVEFIDFECPHCRAFHAKVAQAIATAKVDRPVRIVRKMVPIPRHAGALPAALAWYGADAQGKGDAMAEALIAAPTRELTTEGCERIAAQLGLDVAAFRAACASPEARARLVADAAAAEAAAVAVLPTVYIGATRFQGAGATDAQLVAALRGG
jgi:uncharacterized membrane protein/predicted DsbA family dithiol-disulfide isomerase